ncbi:acyltransferase [Ancylobacter oerskovii]|nr:acyltransferase [Ancylobacter oerskovii]
MVVIYHFIFIVDTPFLQNEFILNSYLFVDFFFVLSGFVVCHAYRDRIRDRRQFTGFLLRRIGRLWPLHLAILFAMMLGVMAINVIGYHPERLLIDAKSGNYSLRALLLNAFLLNSMGFYGSAWNGPAWSIGAEFYTYFLFALVVLTARRKLLLVSSALAVGAVAIIVVFAPAYMNSTADFGYIRCIAGFFTGVGAYHLHAALRHRRLPFATPLELASLALAAAFIVAAGRGPDKAHVLSVLAPLAFALPILVFAREGGLASRLMRLDPLQALGRWSFSIYLIHMPVLVLAVSYGLWLHGDLAGIDLRREVIVDGVAKQLYDVGPVGAGVLLVLVVALVVALAALSFRLVEVPWRDRFARLARVQEKPLRLLPSARMAPRYGAPVPVRVKRR